MSTRGPGVLNSIESFISKTQEITSPDELLEFFVKYIDNIGFEYVAFFMLAENNNYTKKVEDGLLYFNFKQEWMDCYREKKYLEHDPMVELSKTASRPFQWFLDKEKNYNLNEKQQELVNDMHEHGFKTGLVCPVFLPGGRLIHCALATQRTVLDLSESDMIEIGYLCHQIYNRYTELNREKNVAKVISLSQRESDVLHWAAMGKSNSTIADILGISPHTVDTLMRRCFKKLDVSNRTSAVLKAVSSGLISP